MGSDDFTTKPRALCQWRKKRKEKFQKKLQSGPEKTKFGPTFYVFFVNYPTLTNKDPFAVWGLKTNFNITNSPNYQTV